MKAGISGKFKTTADRPEADKSLARLPVPEPVVVAEPEPEPVIVPEPEPEPVVEVVVVEKVEVKQKEDGTVAIKIPTLAFMSNSAEFTDAESNQKTIQQVFDILSDELYAPEDSNSMFFDLSSVTTVDLSNLYTSKVEIMDYMLGDSAGITSILFGPGFDTSNVEYMEGMFQSCRGLESLDVSGFNTSKVTTMHQMFEHCDNLTTLALSSFNTETVTDMGSMFYDCKKLTSLDVSSFDTSSVTSMGDMFDSCSSLVTVYATDKFVAPAPNLSIFNRCTSLVGGTGTKYSDCETPDPDHYKTALYAHIDGGSSNPGYFTLKQ